MPRWTPEARSTQAAKIRSWKPWTNSTGPRTPQGKAACSAAGRRNGKPAPRPVSRDALARELLAALEIMAEATQHDESLRARMMEAMKAVKLAR